MVKRQREVVDYVIAEAAPWALQLLQGENRDAARMHLNTIVRFLEAPGVADVLQSTNNLSAEQWQNQDAERKLSVRERRALERWRVTVLPTLAAITLSDQVQSCCVPKPRKRWRTAEKANKVAAWSADFIAEHPVEESAMTPTSSQSEIVARFETPIDFLPPEGAEDEMSEFGDDDDEQVDELFGQPAADFMSQNVRSILCRSLTASRHPAARLSEPSDAATASATSSPSRGSEITGSAPSAPSEDPGEPWVVDFKQGVQEHGWDEIDANAVQVRGPSYLKDREKVPSSDALFNTLCVDLVSITDPEGVPHISIHPGSAVQELRRAGEKRFLFVVNWRFPPTQMVCVFAMPHGQDFRSDDVQRSRACALFQKVVETMTDAERNARFKVIAWIQDGPWLVRTAVGKTPTLLAKALTTEYFYVPGDHFEVSIDVYSESKARNILGLVVGAAKKLILEVAILFEGQSEEELPEQLVGGFRVTRVDMSRVRGPI